MSSFWSDACKNAATKSLQAQLDAVYGSCGALVRRNALCLELYFETHTVMQIAAYCIGALAGGTTFCRWLRMDKQERQRVALWRLYVPRFRSVHFCNILRMYGWFSGLMPCANICGAVTWVAQLLRYGSRWDVKKCSRNCVLFIAQSRRVKSEAADVSDHERSLLNQQADRWLAVVAVMWSMEFMCLSITQLMVLDRMSDFAATQAQSRRWFETRFFFFFFVETRFFFLFFCDILRRLIWGRVVMVAAVASNVVAVAGSALPAVNWIRSADMFGQASALFAQNKTALGCEMYLQAQKQNQIAYSLAPIYYYAEVVILLLILATFCAVGIACARRISFALRGVRKIAASRIYAPKTSQVFEQAAVEGERLRLHILGTTAFIFVTFLLRSIYSTMRLVAHQLQDNSKSCPGSALGACDASCHNVYASWPLPLCIFVTFFSTRPSNNNCIFVTLGCSYTLMWTWMLRTPEFQV
jgi:hypothetical protein